MEKAIHDVGTLHQARYVLFDNGTRLLVATTFDGDWDVYIDDFAASYILDAWDRFLIHCEGYPDEGKASLTVDEIKEFLTANQVTAADFYMQYPGVTTKEIKQALAVEQAFQQVLDTPGAAEALQHPRPSSRCWTWRLADTATAAGERGRIAAPPGDGGPNHD